MENLIILETTVTPSVNFERNTGILQIKGRSIPVNSKEFYFPVMEWIEQYSSNPSPTTEMRIDLEFFNTGSSKCLFEILKKLKAMKDKGKNLGVKWYYNQDDEGIHEAGKDFQSLIELPMEILRKVV